MKDPWIHASAEVDPRSQIGEETKVWMGAQVREGARIGRGCVIGKDVYVDKDVVLGDHCKIQNGAQIYRKATLEEGVFVGPGACLTNDRIPRAISLKGSPRRDEDWNAGHIYVEKGASIGSGAILLTDTRIGAWAMIGAASMVTRDVGSHCLVLGNPARLVAYVCRCGIRLVQAEGRDSSEFVCPEHGLIDLEFSDRRKPKTE